MNKETIKSYLMVITAMLIWGSIGVFRRHIPVPSDFLAFIRGVLGSAFLLSIIFYTKNTGFNKIPSSTVGLLLLAGAILGCNWIFLFEAFNYTSVSVATLCYYMEPAIVILLSPLFFQNRLTLKKLLVVLLTTCGMAMVAGIGDNASLTEKELHGIVCGLTAALLYALNIILNKRIEYSNTYHRTLIQLMGSALIMVPYLLVTQGFTHVDFSGDTVFFLLIVGIVHTGIAYALYFGGMKKLSAQSVAICSYIDPISALFLSAIILGEGLSFTGIIGASLIIGTALISELKKI